MEQRLSTPRSLLTVWSASVTLTGVIFYTSPTLPAALWGLSTALDVGLARNWLEYEIIFYNDDIKAIEEHRCLRRRGPSREMEETVAAARGPPSALPRISLPFFHSFRAKKCRGPTSATQVGGRKGRGHPAGPPTPRAAPVPADRLPLTSQAPHSLSWREEAPGHWYSPPLPWYSPLCPSVPGSWWPLKCRRALSASCLGQWLFLGMEEGAGRTAWGGEGPKLPLCCKVPKPDKRVFPARKKKTQKSAWISAVLTCLLKQAFTLRKDEKSVFENLLSTRGMLLGYF